MQNTPELYAAQTKNETLEDQTSLLKHSVNAMHTKERTHARDVTKFDLNLGQPHLQPHLTSIISHRSIIKIAQVSEMPYPYVT